MKIKTKTNLLLVVATVLLSYVGFNQSLRLVDKFRKNMKSPCYSFVTSSSVITNPTVTFRDRDKLAPGMRGFIRYESAEEKPEEMLMESVSKEYAQFSIPKKALDVNEFEVWAIDRDEHKSRRKKLYTLDKVIVENSPN